MKGSRLLSAALAVAVVGSTLAAGSSYGRRRLTSDVHALAAQMFAQKSLGVALQRAAIRQDDLLPIYGSSDLNVAHPFHVSALFRAYPSGFTVFPVGSFGSTSLTWLQAIAALGPELRGRKVAVSVSARLFLTDMVDAHAYGANFSRLHANAVAFGSGLSLDVRREAARRMLRYPSTLAGDPLLRFALERLAEGTSLGRLLYLSTVPLGKLRSVVLRLQDDWESLAFVRAQLGLRAVQRVARPLSWTDLLRRAEEDSRRRAARNPYGFDEEFWARHGPEIAMQKGSYAAESAASVMRRSAEWIDFELLLRAIAELGGESLVLAIPINDPYYDHLGVSAAARNLYAERLRALADSHGATLIDFAGTESRNFTIDPAPHLSGEGWVRYGQALERFFHGRGPEAS